MLSDSVIKSVKALDLSDGSVVVVEFDGKATHELFEDITKHIKPYTQGKKVLFILSANKDVKNLNEGQMAKHGWVKKERLDAALDGLAKEIMKQENKGINEQVREAMTEFVDRCDRGEVRSTSTYAKFKRILGLVSTQGGSSNDNQ